MMERFQKDREETASDVSAKEAYKKVMKCLEYEKLEEQGLLLRLPCKVGDTVYQITRDIVSEFEIKTFVCDGKSFYFHWTCVKGVYKNIIGFHSGEIGVDVFLTREEAERKLREMQKNE